MLNETLPEFLRRFGVVLNNSRDTPAILERVQLFGYDLAELEAGQQLYDTLNSLSAAQVREVAEKEGATTAVHNAWQAADQLYGMHRALAKRAFPADSIAAKTLQLHRPKPRSRADWLAQATTFYQQFTDDPTLAAQLGFGQTAEAIAAAAAQVADVARLDREQQRETAEAEKATQDRNNAWAEARVWLATYMDVVRFALADDPQLNEALLRTA